MLCTWEAPHKYKGYFVSQDPEATCFSEPCSEVGVILLEEEETTRTQDLTEMRVIFVLSLLLIQTPTRELHIYFSLVTWKALIIHVQKI